MSYNFSTINDKDLEDLTRDLLSRNMQIDFQSFKKGKDKGIDLRYSTANEENEIIVQVKHYSGSKYANLKSDLKNKELPKIKKLKPKRYIVVTSLPLNVTNKQELKNILAPFIISTNDIYGQDDLNGLLSKYPKIEESHFKLWLSSTTVLKRILKNRLKGRSEFETFKIQSRIKKFVPSKTHKNSVQILNNKHFILITGAPGIGKTMLANILTYQLLAENFELVYITEIKEAEEAFENNKKQIFYFDDFLGTITLDLTSSRNADATLINFIERIRNDKQKRLILTCRTTILNQAKEKSEIISNSKIDISNYEVKIEDYGSLEKAKILYNHIYFSNLTDNFKSVFFENKFYWKIIKHKNYNPRIIEFFTDIDRIQTDNKYEKEIIAFLDNPDKIWEKSFTKQLSENAQILLSTMFSIGGRYVVSENKLKEAFDKRIDFEVDNNNYRRKSNLYNDTLKELQNAFIKRIINIHSNYESIELNFLNPSVEDFLFYYFNSKNIEEYFTILKSSIFTEQFKGRITTKKEAYTKKIYFSGTNYDKLLQIFTQKIPQLKSYSSNKELDIIVTLISLFNWKDIKDIVIKIFNQVKLEQIDWSDKFNLIEILEYFGKNNLTKLIPISLNKIFVKITEGWLSINLLTETLPNLLNYYPVYEKVVSEMKYNDFGSFKEYRNNIIYFWEQNMDKYIQTSNITTSKNKNEIEQLAKEKVKEIKKITKRLKVNNFISLRKYKFDSDKQLKENIEIKSNKNIEIDNITKNTVKVDEIREINRLFNSDDSE